jgi:Xaa-Pro aminopeptidase
MSEAEADLVPPAFLSLAERDRRHTAVQASMAEDGLDVLVLPATANRWEQCMADSRYVSGIGSFGTETLTIVPRGHAPTVYLFNRSAWWKAQQKWVADVRDGRNRWASNIIERLHELGFERGRIGFSGLAGQTRTPDGVVPFGTYAAVAKAFPLAELVDATALVLNLRAIKSDEEVDTLRHSARITDAMVETMTAMAVPGKTERQVYGAMMHTMIDLGGDLPVLAIFASGPDVNNGQFVPTNRVLKRGDRFANEIEARVAGYGAQTVAPLSIGKPDDAYKEAIDVALAGFYGALVAMRPGKTMRDVMNAYREAIRIAGKGRFRHSFPLMHARGLGDEVPIVQDEKALEDSGDVTLSANMTFVVKPRVLREDKAVQAQIGDTVQVTPSGGQRLGKRTLELIVVE